MVGATARAGNSVARVVRTIGYAIVAVLVLHIVLTLLQANPANVVAALIARLAATFDLGLSNLFLVGDPMLSVLLNYGVAALAWLLITALVVRLASRIG
ncbi:MAG: hypothetical protein QOK35_2764 [Pseudonocardiales bacterium]|nr:hypothetical protein [Pseudonocardiales bacterium]